MRLVRNTTPEAGQLSSLLVALGTVDHPDVPAILVTLVDLPLLSASTVRAVLEGYRRTRAPLVRPERDGRHGHPVLFDRSLFDELRSADLERGAKPVVRAHAADGLDIASNDDGAFVDIDTPPGLRARVWPTAVATVWLTAGSRPEREGWWTRGGSNP